jgi:glycosyltransferase involved in cell wall biosynthesis
MTDYRVSVVVPSYQGAHKIGVLLSALRTQSVLPTEVIVVIDGSTDSTEEVVTSFKSTLPIKILTQKNQGRSIAKKNGAQAAAGDILIFYDDDMEPDPLSISKHVSFHQEYAGILAGNQIDVRESNNTDIQNYKVYLSLKWTRKYKMGLNKLDPSNLFFSAANCSVKREDFYELHGFNDLLTDAEDYEFSSRALQKGWAVYFDKSNLAIHHDRITCSSYIKRQRQYRDARKKLNEIASATFSVESGIPIYKKIFYQFFKFSWWPRLIDNHPVVFAWVPKKMRYKIYDFVIYSQTYLK